MAADGTLWVSIDDDESHYLKVLLDEIFGRANFVANVVWQKKYGPANDAKWLSDSHDHILVYAKDKSRWRPNTLIRNEDQLKAFQNPDNDPRGLWRASDLSVRTFSENCMYPIIGPTGLKFLPPPTRSWIVTEQRFAELVADNRITFGAKGTGRPMVKKFLSEVKDGITPETWWPREFAADNKIAKYESKDLFDGDSFATPKPELLLKRIMEIATNPGDLVLDSFAGSGTTGAVAHKMGRRWIMIEMGEHCHTHIIPRMKKVIDGTDQGGISKAVGWKGGGGFRYYRLAPTLIKKDAWGNQVINPQFNPEMVAEAVCKLEGFTYAPSESEFWRQGQSTENDFIYVTTQALSAEQLERISEEVGPKRSLLICCGAFKVKDPERFTNLTLKKLPKAVLDKAEWDKDDYSLQISQLPLVEEEPEEDEEAPAPKRAAKAKDAGQASLFEAAEPEAKKKGKGRGKA
jgi:adenine-specific DNA-methyltransferase